MGARIQIALADLVGNLDIHVSLSSKLLPPQGEDDSSTISTTAGVAIHGAKSYNSFVFDVETGADGCAILTGDFNFFRDEERHSVLMRCLFECSVPFTVIPG